MDDRELVKEAQRGSHAAFRVLVERYQQKLYSLALATVRDPEQAREAVQDALVKAYQHIGDFQGDSSFYTWIYRITVNLCIDRVRRTRRMTQVEFDETRVHDDGEHYEMAPTRLGFDPARALLDREIRQRVLAALEQLSPNHRAVLTLREVEGMSYKEISEVMNCSVGTVMSRLFHARKRMQQMLVELVEEGASPTREASADTDENEDDKPAAKNKAAPSQARTNIITT